MRDFWLIGTASFFTGASVMLVNPTTAGLRGLERGNEGGDGRRSIICTVGFEELEAKSKEAEVMAGEASGERFRGR